MDTISYNAEPNLVGIGLYTVPEASRLTDTPEPSIRRWAQGYIRSRKSNRITHPPVWQRDLDRVGDAVILSFLDLVEVRFIRAFRHHGVPWTIIRKAAAKIVAHEESTHPFSTKRFRTDGKWIFEETLLETGEAKLLNLVRSQYEFRKVIEPSLYRSLVYTEHDEIVRWFPAWPKKRIVIDPDRSFGRPILDREGVPTRVLADAFSAEKSVDFVASLFDVPASGVEAAIEFEEQFLN